jgi:hypothetical protein
MARRRRRLFRRRWAMCPLSRTLRRLIAVLGRLKSGQLGAKLGDFLPIRIDLCRAPRSASLGKACRDQRERFLAAGRLHSHSAATVPSPRGPPFAQRTADRGCIARRLRRGRTGAPADCRSTRSNSSPGRKMPELGMVWPWALKLQHAEVRSFGEENDDCSSARGNMKGKRARAEGMLKLIAHPRARAHRRKHRHRHGGGKGP